MKETIPASSAIGIAANIDPLRMISPGLKAT
jgi:hypothetical protein